MQLPGFNELDEMEQGFDLLQPGNYKAKIDKITEDKDDGNKIFLKVEYVLTDEGYKNRKLFDKIYLMGKDAEKTVTLQRMFKGVLKNLGMAKEQRDALTDTSQFINWALNKAVEVEVSVRKGTGQYEGKSFNEVKTAKALAATDVPFAAG